MRKRSIRVMLLTLATAIAALAVPMLPQAARAADPVFCQNYVQTAIKQAQAALAVGTCSPGAQGPRWSTNPQVHMASCLAQSPAALQREQVKRAVFIRSCRGY